MTVDRHLYNFVLKQRILVSSLPGCIGEMSLVEYEVDSLVVVVEDVLSGPTVQTSKYLLPVGLLQHFIGYSHIRVPRCCLINRQVRFPILPNWFLCSGLWIVKRRESQLTFENWTGHKSHMGCNPKPWSIKFHLIKSITSSTYLLSYLQTKIISSYLKSDANARLYSCDKYLYYLGQQV